LAKAKAVDENIVSIHAPTRGATFYHFSLGVFFLVSIHAPTRGATEALSLFEAQAIVSIHAPTRGATEDFHSWQ